MIRSKLSNLTNLLAITVGLCLFATQANAWWSDTQEENFYGTISSILYYPDINSTNPPTVLCSSNCGSGLLTSIYQYTDSNYDLFLNVVGAAGIFIDCQSNTLCLDAHISTLPGPFSYTDPWDELGMATLSDTGTYYTELDEDGTTYSAYSYAYDVTNVTYSGQYATNMPEPSTWAMMLLGFASLGYAGYRRARAGRATLPA
jgi:hypothetical protein